MALDFDQVSVTTGAAVIVSTVNSHANFPTHVTLRKSGGTGDVWIGNSAVTAADTGGIRIGSGSLVVSMPLYPGNDLYAIAGSTIVVELLIQSGSGD